MPNGPGIEEQPQNQNVARTASALTTQGAVALYRSILAELTQRSPSLTSLTKAGTHNLPLAVTRIIGREETLATLVSRLRERLLTIVGPGGIGKTTVAVAERMIADYEDGDWLIDLSPLGDPRLVPSAVATVLGLEVRTDNPLPGLVAGLRASV